MKVHQLSKNLDYRLSYQRMQMLVILRLS